LGLLLREGEGRGGERGGEGREESVPILPVLRKDHCTGPVPKAWSEQGF